MADLAPAEAPEGGDTPVKAEESLVEVDADVSPEPEKAEAKTQLEGNEADPSPADEPTVEKDTDPPLMTRKEQSRWDELTRQRHESERNSEAWRDQAQRLQSQLQAQEKPTPEPTAAPEKPKTLADFGYDETLYAQHLSGIAEGKAREAAREEYHRYQLEQDNQKVRESYQERADKFAKSHDDYVQIATKSNISDRIAGVVMRLEEGPEVAYFLGQNPEVVSDLNRMPLPMAAVELGRIDTRLSAERKRTKKVSEAPPPPAKVDGGDPHVRKKIDDGSLSDVEFARMRRKQIGRRSGFSTTT